MHLRITLCDIMCFWLRSYRRSYRTVVWLVSDEAGYDEDVWFHYDYGTLTTYCHGIAAWGMDTWARNWASLLNSKTPEGAYSFLKLFVGDRQGLRPPPDEADVTTTKRGVADDADDDKKGLEGEEPESDEKEKTEIPTRMELSKLAACGMDLVECTSFYSKLFGAEKGKVTARDIKLLEMRIELFLWDKGPDEKKELMYEL